MLSDDGSDGDDEGGDDDDESESSGPGIEGLPVGPEPRNRREPY